MRTGCADANDDDCGGHGLDPGSKPRRLHFLGRDTRQSLSQCWTHEPLVTATSRFPGINRQESSSRRQKWCAAAVIAASACEFCSEGLAPNACMRVMRFPGMAVNRPPAGQARWR